jgi:tetratricopeptide (TPR) repeat protein
MTTDERPENLEGDLRAPVPKEQGVLVVDRRPMWRRPVSATIGRLNAASTALVLGTTAPFRRGPCLADNAVQRVAAGFRDADTGDRLELQLGSSMPLRNLIRIWKRRGIGIIGKILGTLMWPFRETIKAIGRVDCYDPFAHSVALYHNDPAILAHELGHAQDFASHRWRILYSLCRAIPLVMLYQEWKASRLGMRNLQSRGLDGDINRANRVMGGGFGSYVGAIVLELIVPGFGILIGAILGQVIGALARPFGRALHLYDAAGKPRPALVVDADGPGVLYLFDDTGTPRAPAPTAQAKLDALTAAVQVQKDSLARTMRGRAMTTEERLERVERGLAKDKAQATRAKRRNRWLLAAGGLAAGGLAFGFWMLAGTFGPVPTAGVRDAIKDAARAGPRKTVLEEVTGISTPAPAAVAAPATPTGGTLLEQVAARATPTGGTLLEQVAARATPTGGTLLEQVAAPAPPMSALDEALDVMATRELDAAWAAMDEKKWSDAAGILRGLSSRQPDNPFVWRALGYLHGHIGNLELAVDAYKTAIRLKPDYAEAYLGLGVVYGQMGHYEEAVEARKTGFRLVNPDDQ